LEELGRLSDGLIGCCDILGYQDFPKSPPISGYSSKIPPL